MIEFVNIGKIIHFFPLPHSVIIFAPCLFYLYMCKERASASGVGETNREAGLTKCVGLFGLSQVFHFPTCLTKLTGVKRPKPQTVPASLRPY